MSISTIRSLSRQWIGRLAHYRAHLHDEHREALVDEALRYVGFHLEADLSGCPYWVDAPLRRRVAVLLFLLDRGILRRVQRDGRILFEVDDEAEDWACSQTSLLPYLTATLALIDALRKAQGRAIHSAR